MTTALAFLRLAWRPVMLLAIPFCLAVTAMILSLDGVRSEIPKHLAETLGWEAAGPSRGHVIRLLGFLFPAMLGFIVGQMLHEVQHTWFSWLVPGLRRKLTIAFLITGAVVAAGSLAGERALGHLAPVLPSFSLAFLWFALGATVESSIFTLRTTVPSGIAAAILFIAGLQIDRVGAQRSEAPMLTTLAALALAGAWSLRRFSLSDARERIHNPRISVLSSGNERARARAATQILAQSAPSRAVWKVDAMGTGFRPWFRAGLYENFGATRLGWIGRMILIAASCALIAAIFGFQDGYEVAGSARQGFEFITHVLFSTPPEGKAQGNVPPYWATYAMIAQCLWIVVYAAPFFLQRGRLYPLSRRQLGRMAYRGSLFQLMLALVFVAAGLYVLGIVARLGAGQRVSLEMPTYLHCLAAGAVLLPIPQWLAFRNRPCGGSLGRTLLNAAVFIAAAFLVAWWGWKGAGMDPGAEIALLAGLFAASQLLYRWQLGAYFLRGDLV